MIRSNNKQIEMSKEQAIEAILSGEWSFNVNSGSRKRGTVWAFKRDWSLCSVIDTKLVAEILADRRVSIQTITIHGIESRHLLPVTL